MIDLIQYSQCKTFFMTCGDLFAFMVTIAFFWECYKETKADEAQEKPPD